jgi:hypothetical protein
MALENIAMKQNKAALVGGGGIIIIYYYCFVPAEAVVNFAEKHNGFVICSPSIGAPFNLHLMRFIYANIYTVLLLSREAQEINHFHTEKLHFTNAYSD